MTLQLYLVRHAKATPADEGLEDFERPLNERGRRDATRMAQEASRLTAGTRPTLLSSPAVRAITTARRFAEALNVEARAIRIDARLYEAGTGDWMQVLAEQPDAVSPLLAFGHNPGISDLGAWLCPEARALSLPTAGLLRLELAILNWASIDRDCGRKPLLRAPRDLAPEG